MKREELILNYFLGKLSGQEQDELNRLLKTDNEFQEQFYFEQKLQQAAQQLGNELQKEQLIAFEREIEQEQKRKSTNRFKPSVFLKVAASLLLLAVIGWLGSMQLEHYSNQKLVAENYQVYPNTMVSISRGDTVDTLERTVFLAYQNGDYEEALQKMNDLTDPPLYITFYKAQCYTQLNEYELAEENYKTVIESESSFAAQAQWYLALLELKQNNREKAISELQLLISNYEYQAKQAKVLLEELK